MVSSARCILRKPAKSIADDVVWLELSRCGHPRLPLNNRVLASRTKCLTISAGRAAKFSGLQD